MHTDANGDINTCFLAMLLEHSQHVYTHLGCTLCMLFGVTSKSTDYHVGVADGLNLL